MRKYVYIQDISATGSYRNVNARLLYLHIACNCDVSTYNYTCSTRRLAADLGMSHQCLRTALRNLVDDGLASTQLVTHTTTRGLTQPLTQPLTQIHVVKINELNEAANEAANTAANTSANTAANTAANTDKNNLNNNNKYPPLTDEGARACEQLLQQELGLTAQEAAAQVAAFGRRMGLKRKSWADEADMLAHCLSWAEKHTERRRTSRRDDTQARADERARAEAEAAGLSDEEKRKEEAARWWRFYNEAAGKDDERNRKWRETCRKHLQELGYQINAT